MPEFAFFRKLVCCMYMCVMRVCPPTRVIITTHMKGTVNKELNKIYHFSVLDIACAINIISRCGMNNKAYHKFLPNKKKVIVIFKVIVNVCNSHTYICKTFERRISSSFTI